MSSKISQLTELTTISDTDALPINDTTNSTTKKTLWSTIKTTIATYLASLTQTLTNKTMTGATNTLTASLLKSATTEVSVSAAIAPTSGQVLTATGANTATWQNPSGATDYSCNIYQNAVTSITSSWVSIAFQVENFDTDTMHDTVTNNTRITFIHAGKYCVGGGWFGATNSVTGIRIRVNGTTVIATSIDGNAGTNLEFNSISTFYNFSANDYIEIQGYSGTTQNTSGDSQTYGWAFKVA